MKMTTKSIYSLEKGEATVVSIDDLEYRDLIDPFFEVKNNGRFRQNNVDSYSTLVERIK